MSDTVSEATVVKTGRKASGDSFSGGTSVTCGCGAEAACRGRHTATSQALTGVTIKTFSVLHPCAGGHEGHNTNTVHCALQRTRGKAKAGGK